MNHKLFTTLSGLSISALLVVGLMAFGQAPRLPAAIDDGLLVETIETGALQATGETMVPRERKHRNRTPLAMPYFSFAKSLRPGS